MCNAKNTILKTRTTTFSNWTCHTSGTGTFPLPFTPTGGGPPPPLLCKIFCKEAIAWS